MYMGVHAPACSCKPVVKSSKKLPGLLQVNEVALQQAAIKRSSITEANLRFLLTLSLWKPFLYGCLHIMPLLSLLWQARGPAALCHESHSQVARLWSEAPVALGLIWTSRGLVGERGQRQRLSTYVASDWLCGEWKSLFNRFYRLKSAGFQIKTAVTQKTQNKSGTDFFLSTFRLIWT